MKNFKKLFSKEDSNSISSLREDFTKKEEFIIDSLKYNFELSEVLKENKEYLKLVLWLCIIGESGMLGEESLLELNDYNKSIFQVFCGEEYENLINKIYYNCKVYDKEFSKILKITRLNEEGGILNSLVKFNFDYDRIKTIMVKTGEEILKNPYSRYSNYGIFTPLVDLMKTIRLYKLDEKYYESAINSFLKAVKNMNNIERLGGSKSYVYSNIILSNIILESFGSREYISRYDRGYEWLNETILYSGYGKKRDINILLTVLFTEAAGADTLREMLEENEKFVEGLNMNIIEYINSSNNSEMPTKWLVYMGPDLTTDDNIPEQ